MRVRTLIIALSWLACLFPSGNLYGASRPFRHLYLGLAGYTRGMGILGHGFVILSRTPGQMLDATAYQYNIELPPTQDGQPPDLTELLKHDRFTLSAEPALVFIRKYTRQERAVLLFRADIFPEDVEKIHGRLEQERADRRRQESNDYSVVSNNCLTKVVDIINAHVPAAKRIATVWEGERFNWTPSLISPAALTANAPLTLARHLEKHPLFPEPPMHFRPDGYFKLRTDIIILDNLKRMGALCGWNERKTDFLLTLFAKRDLRVSEAALRLFREVALQCRAIEREDLFQETLSLVELSDERIEVRKLIEKYGEPLQD